MENFNYAHNDTSKSGRKTPAAFNNPRVSAAIAGLRESAFARSIPTANDETLNFLITLVRALKPEKILELGTATGISGAAMLEAYGGAHLTTVERSEEFYSEALKNFSSLNISGRVTAVLGDAGEVINNLDGDFDFIFLDCAKVQYVKYLPRLKQLLKSGGVLLADDVLLYGWITGENPVPPKRKMLARHIEEYLNAAINDSELYTTVINSGDGMALSVKQ